MPLSRSIATEAISAFIRARAIGLSLTSTTCDRLRRRELARDGEHGLGVAAARRVELDRNDELAAPGASAAASSPPAPGEAGRAARARGRTRSARSAHGARRRPRGSRRSRPASSRSSRRSACAQPCAHARRSRRSTPAWRVGRRCGRRRSRRARRSAARRAACRRGPIASSARSAARSPAPWFAPNAASAELAQRSAASAARTPPSVSPSASKLISATIGSDETPRTASTAVTQLAEVVERLDHEQVDAAALEQSRLLGEERAAVVVRVVALSPSGPIEPPMKTSRPEISRASRASFTAVRLIALQLALEEVRPELAAVRAEGVRLDQVGAGADEAEVQRDRRSPAPAGSPPPAPAGPGRRRTAARPMPPSATRGGPSRRRSTKRVATPPERSQAQRSTTKG